jgi:ribosomal protein S18 acetylase RimI-like enzyme
MKTFITKEHLNALPILIDWLNLNAQAWDEPTSHIVDYFIGISKEELKTYCLYEVPDDFDKYDPSWWSFPGIKMVGYTFVNYSDFKNGILNIDDLVIDENCRGRGLGLQLLEHVIDEITTTQFGTIKQVTLQVETTNKPAIKIYRNLGFEIVEELKDYYDEGRHAYQMKLPL